MIPVTPRIAKRRVMWVPTPRESAVRYAWWCKVMRCSTPFRNSTAAVSRPRSTIAMTGTSFAPVRSEITVQFVRTASSEVPTRRTPMPSSLTRDSDVMPQELSPAPGSAAAALALSAVRTRSIRQAVARVRTPTAKQAAFIKDGWE